MDEKFFEFNLCGFEGLSDKKINEITTKLHYCKSRILELENKNNLLKDENKELKEITKQFRSAVKENESDFVIIADRRYFLKGILQEQFVPVERIMALINRMKQECKKIKWNEKCRTQTIYKSLIADLNEILRELEK